MAHTVTHDDLVRKSRGITSAHQRAAVLEGDLDAIREWLTEISMSLALVERTATQVPALQGDVTSLRSQLTELIRTNATSTVDPQVIASLEERIDKLAGDLAVLTDRVDVHDTRLDKAEGRLDGHDELFDELKRGNREDRGRVVIIGESVARAHARIDVLEQVRGIHPMAWILGIIAGIVGGIVWAGHGWEQNATVNDVKVTVENTAANSVWAAALAGLAIGLLVLFVVSLFTGRTHRSTHTAEADAAAASWVASDTNTDSTRVQPVVAPTPPPQPVANRQ